MQYLKIKGNTHLGGVAKIHGAKNSVLPILASTVLIKGESVIHNCPQLSDVQVTIDILKHLGAKVQRNNSTLIVDTTSINNSYIPESLMQEMRSSIIFLGSLSSRTGKATMFLPGGCEIGLRPIDLHLKGLRQLGYSVCFDGHNITCTQNNVAGAKIVLPFPSVGATENILLASVLAKGTTTIVNSAREPEIEDLANFLNKAGANIKGAGSTVITVCGVERLYGVEHIVIPDRILATTMMSASAITNSPLVLDNICVPHLMPVIPVFDEMGCKISIDNNSLKINPSPQPKKVRRIKTMPYPGFPTDCQAPLMAVLTISKGTSIINETIFESRYKHISQLNRFGADISVHDKIAVINGVKALHSTSAYCTDLRGGAAVIIASLCAHGESTVYDIHHIDRGYEKIENQLSAIGADIKRIKDEK